MNATRERPEIRFLTSGDVSAHERAEAERAVRTALADAEGATSVQVTLSVVADASLPRPALAQAVVDLNGRRVRAQAAAPRIDEAIDMLRERLAIRASSSQVS
ncbi:hypothetical protein [Actinomadura livida]|uniref:HPF/RaiA family ribosome-associated protein n=1 Tax=Actinomadura livida TaxID=79909 RepID=A0A7W7MYI3_9ACTN|nr:MULTISPECIES: hypothetical protein [Actinomadura]MBB4775808.1 hypothetical protein [Actinomadura catellatispora]GGU35432.1 hypothetical protein GCM10010208_69990 [Actinomadura livida]